ncbi:hypothetical protein OJ252_3761, partial [Cryptosporidium canis]
LLEEEEKERIRLLEEEEKERIRLLEEERRWRIIKEEEEEKEKERRRIIKEEEEEKERIRLLEEEKERRRIIKEEEEEKERIRLLEEEKERRRIEEEERERMRIKQIEKEDVLDLGWGWGESEEIGSLEEDQDKVDIVNGDISCKREEEIEVDGVRRSTLGFTSFLDDFVSHISGSIKDDDTENRGEEEEEEEAERRRIEEENNGANFRDIFDSYNNGVGNILMNNTGRGGGNNISSFTGFVSNIKSFFNDDRSKYMVDWNLKKIQDNQ